MNDISLAIEQQDIDALITACASLELQLAEKSCSAEIQPQDLYSIYLAALLLKDERSESRYLWKRIPNHLKEKHAVISSVWSIGTHLFRQQLSSMYAAMEVEWHGPLQPLILWLQQTLQRRSFDLIAESYSSIRIDEVSRRVGLSVEATIALVLENGWTRDGDFLVPLKPQKASADASLVSEGQLEALTNYVMHLEKR